MNCLGAYKKRLEWKHKTEPSLFDRHDDNNMSNVARHPSSSTKLTFYKYYDDPSEVMLNNGQRKDNFSTAKASSFVNVTKKRKVKEKLDVRNDQNVDDIRILSTNSKEHNEEHKNCSSSQFCSINNKQFYNDSVINGGKSKGKSFSNKYLKSTGDKNEAHFYPGIVI